MSKQFSQLLYSLLRITLAAKPVVAAFLLWWLTQASGAEPAVGEASPLASSKSAALLGKSHYLINCQQCHDADGRALASIDFIAANLTAPDTWFYGTAPLNIFYSIKNGAGLDMPPFKDALSDEVIWQIVAHVRSIGPEQFRPRND